MGNRVTVPLEGKVGACSCGVLTPAVNTGTLVFSGFPTSATRAGAQAVCAAHSTLPLLCYHTEHQNPSQNVSRLLTAPSVKDLHP